MNTTVTHVNGSGFMTNYPAGGTAPLSNFVFYNKNVAGTSNPTFVLAAALVNPAGSVYAGSPRVLDVVKQATGYFRIEVDTSVNYCTPMVHTYYPNEYATASTPSGQYVYVHGWNLNATTHVETPVDDSFYLPVSC